MRPLFFLLALLAAAPLRAEPPSDARLLESIRQRAESMVSVTPQPVLLESPTALLCRPPTEAESASDAANPHLHTFARLFVSRDGLAAATGHEPVHPEGSLLLKEKRPAAAGDQPGSTPELFTGMLKREPGFNPECGDWEFFTASGDGQKITSRGKSANCIDCHRKYAGTDFVTRKLVPERRIAPAAGGSILLHSRDAYVSGRQMRYEPQPHKNTLGYWTQQGDTAAWYFAIPAAAAYEVEVLQGCGTGSGGAGVKIAAFANGEPAGELTFTVRDTGHFQNFIPLAIGTLNLPKSSLLTLKVIPQSKPGGAVMDLRQITLRPVPAR